MITIGVMADPCLQARGGECSNGDFNGEASRMACLNLLHCGERFLSFAYSLAMRLIENEYYIYPFKVKSSHTGLERDFI